MSANGREGDAIEIAAERLLHSHRVGRPQALVPLAGGANNRVYRVDAGGGRFLVKAYFRHTDDPRDRFAAERAFYEFAAAAAARSVPAPLVWDPELRAALFEFVDGVKLRPGEVNAEHVRQAAGFLASLNHPKRRAVAVLPDASEACFSIEEHLSVVDRRIKRLRALEPEEEVDHEARSFVLEHLAPTWAHIRSGIEREARARRLDGTRPLAASERCVSPSDFGFHNALLEPPGTLRFFDFEYAGWDDAAKAVCDFFCQPQVPVPADYWGEIVASAASGEAVEGVDQRSRLLLPAYQIKWCCIRLNEFLRVDRARRSFSAGARSVGARKREQLDRAREALARISAGGAVPTL